MFQRVLSQIAANESTPFTTAQQVMPGDFNGDGIGDLAVQFIVGSGGTGDPIKFYLGDGSGSYIESTTKLFEGQKPYPVVAARIFPGDFNRDGRTDVLVPDFGIDRPPFPGGQSEVILTDKASSLVVATGNLPRKLNQTHGAAVGDIDGDGDLDAILISLNAFSGDAIEVLLGDGTGHFVESNKLAPSSYQNAGWNQGNTWGALVDVDGDRALDLILGPSPDGRTPGQVYLNNGRGDFSKIPPVALPSSSVPMAAAQAIESIDLNNDGHLDLIISLTDSTPGSSAFYNVPYLQFLVNDGAGHFRDETAERLPQSKVLGEGWIKFIQPADVNHDGALDLVTSWYYKVSPWIETRIFLNDGFGHFQQMDDRVAGTTTAITDGQGRVLNFVSVHYSNEYSGQGLFVIANDASAEAAPIIRAPAFTVLPAVIVHRFFNDQTSPGADKLAALSQFSFDQFRSYKDFGVARPELGPYEALGRGFAETTKFQQEYSALPRAVFVDQAYNEVFERAATAVQSAHFQAQIAYFESIYDQAGIGAADASLLAKGAVLGQMLGHAVWDESSDHVYISTARESVGLTGVKANLVGGLSDLAGDV